MFTGGKENEMSRYIDADALKEWLDEYLSVFKKYDKGTIKGFVDHAPSIDIVRCGECRHKDDCEQEVLLLEMCGEVADTAHITYCSYGEREGE